MKTKKKFLRKLVGIIVAFVLITNCSMVTETTAITKLKVTVPSKKVAINTTLKINTNVKATFKSSNKKIATVNSKGIISGKKPGKVIITITSKGNKSQKKKVVITVKKKLIITSPSNLKKTIAIGKTFKISQNLSCRYRSSNSNIVTVNNKGLVTGKNAGSAKITVIDKKYGLKKSILVTVNGKDKNTFTTEDTSNQNNTTTENNTTETSKVPESTLVSISAEYTGSTVPYYCSIDVLNNLKVTANFSDGSTKELSYPEYSLSSEVCDTTTSKTITVTYKGLQTTFEVYGKRTSYDYVVSLDLSGDYSSHPIDVTKIKVYFSTLMTSYESTDYSYKYLGITEINGVKNHQYYFYYTEDFVDDCTNFHNFVSREVLIPIK